MLKKMFGLSLLALACCIAINSVVLAGGAFAGDKVPRMEPTELAAMLDSPNMTIIDVRRGKDWSGSEEIIKNAVRKPYNDVANWADDFPKDRTIVLYCA